MQEKRKKQFLVVQILRLNMLLLCSSIFESKNSADIRRVTQVVEEA